VKIAANKDNNYFDDCATNGAQKKQRKIHDQQGDLNAIKVCEKVLRLERIILQLSERKLTARGARSGSRRVGWEIEKKNRLGVDVTKENCWKQKLDASWEI
jgi:hypothetical protein